MSRVQKKRKKNIKSLFPILNNMLLDGNFYFSCLFFDGIKNAPHRVSRHLQSSTTKQNEKCTHKKNCIIHQLATTLHLKEAIMNILWFCMRMVLGRDENNKNKKNKPTNHVEWTEETALWTEHTYRENLHKI